MQGPGEGWAAPRGGVRGRATAGEIAGALRGMLRRRAAGRGLAILTWDTVLPSRRQAFHEPVNTLTRQRQIFRWRLSGRLEDCRNLLESLATAAALSDVHVALSDVSVAIITSEYAYALTTNIQMASVWAT
jgi:hypothetical protein